ncbi:MAG: M16 family metallopeptidase [Hyphomicrobiales bacterium]
MINFKRYQLDNGLTVLIHKDESTPLAAVNTLYKVGARDENPERTGFAHLFEHLMFSGSVNIPDYDLVVDKVGGENNAFTNSDYTNYYVTLPVQNLETALWLESDRMLNLAFNEKGLDVQKSVVTEEYKQVFLNQPYGDIWLHLRPLAYKEHPYRWVAIGKDISHITNSTMDEVRAFYKKYYNPNNAILSIAGNLDEEETLKLVKKWFDAIPAGEDFNRNIPKESPQKEFRTETLKRNVPFDAIYMSFHMPDRLSQRYYVFDLLSDVLSNGLSSRLHKRLVKQQKLFRELQAYISGDLDPGLFIISGKLYEGTSMKKAEQAIINELELISKELINEEELQKIQNKIESTLIFSELNVLNKAMNIAYFEFINHAEDINLQAANYRKVTAEDIRNAAKDTFVKDNCSVLYYLASEAE